MARARLRNIGQVVVDSGTIVICDPCNGQLAAEAIDAVDHSQQHFGFGPPVLELGVILQTAVGDGTYDVYAEFGPHPWGLDEQVIRRVEIRFY
jgi:hypothetical protein